MFNTISFVPWNLPLVNHSFFLLLSVFLPPNVVSFLTCTICHLVSSYINKCYACFNVSYRGAYLMSVLCLQCHKCAKRTTLLRVFMKSEIASLESFLMSTSVGHGTNVYSPGFSWHFDDTSSHSNTSAPF